MNMSFASYREYGAVLSVMIVSVATNLLSLFKNSLLLYNHNAIWLHFLGEWRFNICEKMGDLYSTKKMSKNGESFPMVPTVCKPVVTLQGESCLWSLRPRVFATRYVSQIASSYVMYSSIILKGVNKKREILFSVFFLLSTETQPGSGTNGEMELFIYMVVILYNV